jgi:prevent-host-death family protein
MKEISSTDAQNGFGAVLKGINKGMVTVTLYNKPYAVVLSINEYQELLGYKDMYWQMVAAEALNEGFISEEELIAWLVDRFGVQESAIKEILTRSFHESHSARRDNTGLSLQFSVQARVCADNLNVRQFEKFITYIIKLRDIDAEPSMNVIKFEDVMGFKVAYDFTEDMFRVIYMERNKTSPSKKVERT